jgi:hypothetical protein
MLLLWVSAVAAALAPLPAFGLGQLPEPTITSVWPKMGSYFGGTRLVIEGSGFMMPAEANPWDSQSVAVGAIPCRIIDHHTSSTRIVCVTGPWPPFADSLELTVTVQVFALIGGAQIAQKDHAFQYRFDNTPWIQSGSHWAASGGDLLRFSARTYWDVDAADQIEVRIGDVICETDPEERPLIAYARYFFGLDCRLPLSVMLLPGHYNVSLRLRVLSPSDDDCPNSACEVFSHEDSRTGDHGWGHGVPAKAFHAWSWARNMWRRRMWQFRGSVDLASGTRSEFTVFPRVDAVEPAAGSVYGGNLVTLRAYLLYNGSATYIHWQA